MKRPLLIAAVVALLAVAGWWGWRQRGGQDPAGSVTLEWRGSARGKVRLPGRIAWCPVTRMATLTAVRGDTGFLVTLLEPDSLSVGRHQVVTPANRDLSPKPNATASLRWVKDTTAVVGFASVSGVVELSATGERVSGSMDLRLRMPSALDTLVLKGDFRGLPVVSSAVGCP